jgi:hypothetical protein
LCGLIDKIVASRGTFHKIILDAQIVHRYSKNFFHKSPVKDLPSQTKILKEKKKKKDLSSEVSSLFTLAFLIGDIGSPAIAWKLLMNFFFVNLNC